MLIDPNQLGTIPMRDATSFTPGRNRFAHIIHPIIQKFRTTKILLQKKNYFLYSKCFITINAFMAILIHVTFPPRNPQIPRYTCVMLTWQPINSNRNTTKRLIALMSHTHG